jgi:hypothetical protein
LTPNFARLAIISSELGNGESRNSLLACWLHLLQRNQVSMAAVLDRDSNAARRAHRLKSVTSDIGALPAQRRCAALATTPGPQAAEITQA